MLSHSFHHRESRLPLLPACLLVCFFLPGCLFTFKTNPALNQAAFQESPPRKVAILPFLNKTDSSEADVLARSSFFNSLASKSYSDVELSRVDDVLARAAVETGEDPMDLDPRYLAEKLGVDGLFYGVVEDMSKFYIIFYSHLKVRLSIRLFDAGSNSYIYSDTATALNRDIAPAASPLGVITSLIETWWHLRKSEKVQTFERLARRMVKEIPDPGFSTSGHSDFIHSMEVKVPATQLKTDDPVEVTIRGTPGKKAEFDIGKIRRNISMTEKEPGIYKGIYRIREGDNLDYALVRGRLSDEAYSQEKIHFKNPFQVDTNPPNTPGILVINSNKKDFWVHVTPPEDEDFDHYILYKTLDPEKGYMEESRSKKPVFRQKKLEPGETIHYRVMAVDLLGNPSPLSPEASLEVPPRGPTRLEGDITRSTTLYAFSSPFIIDEIVRVSENAILTIEPGVEIRFGKQGGLLVEGVLFTAGDRKHPVRITGDDGWQGIKIQSRGQLKRSRVSHLSIRNASWGIRIEEGRLEAQYLEVKDCTVGISAGREASLRVVDSIFTKNHLALRSSAPGTIIKNCDFIKNTYMTEFTGVPEKQESSKVRGFTHIQY